MGAACLSRRLLGPTEPRQTLVDSHPCARYDAPYTRAPIDLAIVAIIPARFGSSRLPGKPLSEIRGKPMVQHVYERAAEARLGGSAARGHGRRAVVAAVRGFGGEAVMTSAHACQRYRPPGRGRRSRPPPTPTIVVNVQGDEPMLDPAGSTRRSSPCSETVPVPVSTLSLPLYRPRRHDVSVGGEGRHERPGTRSISPEARYRTCASIHPAASPRPQPRPWSRGLPASTSACTSTVARPCSASHDCRLLRWRGPRASSSSARSRTG